MPLALVYLGARAAPWVCIHRQKNFHHNPSQPSVPLPDRMIDNVCQSHSEYAWLVEAATQSRCPICYWVIIPTVDMSVFAFEHLHSLSLLDDHLKRVINGSKGFSWHERDHNFYCHIFATIPNHLVSIMGAAVGPILSVLNVLDMAYAPRASTHSSLSLADRLISWFFFF